MTEERSHIRSKNNSKQTHINAVCDITKVIIDLRKGTATIIKDKEGKTLSREDDRKKG